jgi:hypothetical protein
MLLPHKPIVRVRVQVKKDPKQRLQPKSQSLFLEAMRHYILLKKEETAHDGTEHRAADRVCAVEKFN